MIFQFLALLVVTSLSGWSSSQTLDYLDSIRAIANNQISDVHDGSKGTVWFNTTGYGLADYGFPLIDNYGVSTYSTFNYLTTVTSLAGKAAANQYHGDVVFLLYKFLYAGNVMSTRLEPESDMVKDMITDLIYKNTKSDPGALLQILIDSSSTPELRTLYGIVSDNSTVLETHKL